MIKKGYTNKKESKWPYSFYPRVKYGLYLTNYPSQPQETFMVSSSSSSSLSDVKRLKSSCIQLFQERLWEKVHASILKGIVGGFEFTVLQRNLKELARKAMKMSL